MAILNRKFIKKPKPTPAIGVKNGQPYDLSTMVNPIKKNGNQSSLPKEKFKPKPIRYGLLPDGTPNYKRYPALSKLSNIKIRK